MKKNNSTKDIISEILYDDFLGTQDPDIPKDEYDSEAEELLMRIREKNGLNPHIINVTLTEIMHEYFGYDFTEYEFAEGAYTLTAQRIYDVLSKKRNELLGSV